MRVTDKSRGSECINVADGISGIEHVGMGIARVDGNAARVAGASTGQCE